MTAGKITLVSLLASLVALFGFFVAHPKKATKVETINDVHQHVY